MTTGTNDFKTFAGGGGANVVTQAAYAALTSILANGFSSGTANSQQLNKVWRQATAISNAIGQLIANQGLDALDDGNSATLLSNMTTALKLVSQGGTPVTVTATGALTVSQSGNISVDATGGSIVITLPAASAANGNPIYYGFTRIDASVNTVTIQRAGSDTINGAVSFTLPSQWSGAEIFGNGVSAWRILNAQYATTAGGLASGATGTTQAYGDNTTAIATDAFVQSAKGNASSAQSVNSNSTLTASSVGATTVFTGASVSSITLYTIPSGTGQRMTLLNNSSNGIIFTAPTGLIVNQNGFSSTTITVNKGARLSLVWDGTNYVIENYAPVGDGQAWTADLGPSGLAQRASGTTYTNTTGRSIMVTIGITAVSGSPGIVVVVGGSQIYGFYPPYGTGNPLSFIVPPGATYSGTLNAGTTLTNWNELR